MLLNLFFPYEMQRNRAGFLPALFCSFINKQSNNKFKINLNGSFYNEPSLYSLTSEQSILPSSETAGIGTNETSSSSSMFLGLFGFNSQHSSSVVNPHACGTQPPTPKTVAESLRYHRLRMHLSITALATLAGLSRDAIAKIERGKFGLRRANAINLANVLGITPRELLAVDAMPETTLSERFYKAKAINVHEWPDVSKVIGVSARTIRDYVECRRHQNGSSPAFAAALKKYIEDALKS